MPFPKFSLDNILGLMKKVGAANVQALKTVMKLTIGTKITSSVTAFVMSLLPARFSGTEAKLPVTVVKILTSQAAAIALTALKPNVKQEHHKYIDVAIDSAVLATAQAGVEQLDGLSLIAQLLGKDTADLVKQTVDIEENEAAIEEQLQNDAIEKHLIS